MTVQECDNMSENEQLHLRLLEICYFVLMPKKAPKKKQELKFGGIITMQDCAKVLSHPSFVHVFTGKQEVGATRI